MPGRQGEASDFRTFRMLEIIGCRTLYPLYNVWVCKIGQQNEKSNGFDNQIKT